VSHFVDSRLSFLYLLLDVRVAKAHVATNVRHNAFATKNLALNTFTSLKRSFWVADGTVWSWSAFVHVAT
jgi:ribosome maturation protein Sdo1